MAAFIKLDGVDGEANAAHSDVPPVQDIQISKDNGGADNVELTVKVLDAGGTFYGAMTNVEYTLTVTDTQTGTERESGLTYSGESGGLNESDDPGDLTTDGSYLGVKLPDVLVTSWQTGASEADTQVNQPSWGLDRIDQSASGSGGGTGKVSVHDISISKQDGPSFFAYDAGFRGGVDGAASGTGDGLWKESFLGNDLVGALGDTAQDGFTLEPMSGPMKESMETMKKAWTDASGTPEGPTSDAELIEIESMIWGDTDAAAPGNTYLGMTTIEQGALEVDHGLMMLNYQYDLG